jgi:alpha-glucosidase
VFTWNHDKFPDPRALNSAFAAAGMRTVANLKPCLLDDHPAYAEVARGRRLRARRTPAAGAWSSSGTAGARTWTSRARTTPPGGSRHLREQMLDVGIDVGWNDNNEYADLDDGARSHGFGQALPMHRSRPLHGLLMTRATFEAQQAAHKPGAVYTVTRAGPPGLQRYAQTWTGDNTTSWDTMRWNLRMAMTMSLSGMFNTGHDIGGFDGPVPDPEMLMRWTQACCLVPRMIMNSWKADGSVNSPWLHGEATAPIDDPATWADNDEMMVGPDLLVAPVFEPHARTRRLYLPRTPHGWHDWWTGAHHAGGQWVDVPAPLHRLPLFVRAGALVPVTDSPNDRARTEEPSRALLWFPAREGDGNAWLYEDDGAQAAGDDAHRVLHRFSAQSHAATLRLSLHSQGAWPLPYRQIRVVLPEGERRKLALMSSGPVDLRA